ncbi:MAG: 50S ribosomal protein L10 [Nanoarchaeota archaeon]|nr:50S ribosomal protein L10 [Nanoarchaeota archaeon]
MEEEVKEDAQEETKVEEASADKVKEETEEESKPEKKKKANAPEAHVNPSKKKLVKTLVNLIKENKSFVVVSVKNIPGKQFQEIKKVLSEKVKLKYVKKSIIYRAIDEIDGELTPMKEHIKEDVALLFSDADAFELSGMMANFKSPAKAKVGQEAPENIVIEPGPTEILPGPAVGEFSVLGIKVAVEDGKIAIKTKKVLVKKGEKITAQHTAIMDKLDIKPFKIGFEPIAAYDREEKKIYVGIKVDKEATLEELKTSFAKALGFAVNICYVNKDTLPFILGKAAAHEAALSKIIEEKGGASGEKKDEEKVEETKAEEAKEEVVEEKKDDAGEKKDEGEGK